MSKPLPSVPLLFNPAIMPGLLRTTFPKSITTRLDDGRWPIGDRTAQDLVHPSSAHGRRGEPLTGTRKRPLRPEE